LEWDFVVAHGRRGQVALTHADASRRFGLPAPPSNRRCLTGSRGHVTPPESPSGQRWDLWS
jgi:hypothetical protein